MADCPNCESLAKQNEKLLVALQLSAHSFHTMAALHNYGHKEEFSNCEYMKCKQALEVLEGK